MRWETKVIGVRPQPSTRRETSLGTGQTDTAGATMQVQLASGETLRADIVIAADGARSTIRRHYNASASAGGLDYAGVAIVSGVSQFPSPEDVPQRIRACWGLVISGTGTGLFVSPVDNTSALWSLSYYTEERVEDRRWPMSNDVLEKLMAKAKELASSFDGTVNELVDKTNLATLMQLSAMDRPAFAHHVQRDGNVVWLGDANHAVSPFAGNGANLALNDGWDFAEALLTTSTGFEGAVKSYDKDAMPRAQQTRKMSRWVIDFAHATGWKLWVYLFLLRVMSWVFLRGNRKVQTQKERAD
ncbi:uncharacterized protein HMPREF1541_00421 [Cyphellophora europaea CBS 101466]|uniref:FAD-binding domain-containing protein n=1 Tax=Cyphellophora europaea (strain CBS 101466) TaxID=1220924 RepID=W2SC01_CYPE1|nr:uncharacterized protein HMPREF1541_00421 [Cyphellophora europaea CBS 101466]ETN46237.1 hypothetical protein HMPREF1541_00421 [Cyphellophora europaea CBS 101466]